MALGGLVVKLALEYAQYTQGLDKSSQEALKFGKSVQDSIDKAKRATSDFVGGVVSGAVAAVASYQTLQAAIQGVTSAINRLDEIGKTAQRVGVAAETLQELAYAGSLADVSLESLATSSKKLSQAMVEAATGGKEQAAIFRALGVEIKAADGTLRASSDVMADVAQVFSEMEDGAAKTALAVKVFGKAGADMIPLLNGGRDALRESAEEARKFGLVLGEDALKNAEAFNDNITRLGKITEGTFNQIAAGVLPVLVDFSAALVDSASDIDSVNAASQRLNKDGSLQSWAKSSATALTYLMDVGEGVWRFLKGLGQLIAGLTAAGVASISGFVTAFARLQSGNFSGALDAIKVGFGSISAVIGSLGADLADTFGSPTLGAKIRERLDQMKVLGNNAADAGKKTRDANAILRQLGENDGAKKAAEAMKKLLAEAQKLADLRNKENADIDAYLRAEEERRQQAARSAEAAAQQAEDEIANRGKLRSEIEETVLARMEENLLTKQQGSDAFNALQREIDARKRVIAAYRKGEAIDAQAAADQQARAIAESRQAAYMQTWNDIAGGVADVLEAAISGGGKEGWANLRKMIERDAIRVAINIASGQIASAALGGGAASGASLFGQANGAYGTGSALAYAAGGAYGLTGLSTGASAASLTYANAVGAVGGDSLGALIAANGSWSGVGAGAAGAGAGAGAGGAAAGGASAGGTSALAVVGWAAIIVAILYAIFGDFSKFSMGSVAEGKFDSDGKFSRSQFADYEFGNNPEKERDASFQSGLRDGVAAAIAGNAKFFGGQASGFGIGVNTDADRENEIAALLRLTDASGNTIAGVQTGTGAFGSGGPTGAAAKIQAADLQKWIAENLPIVIVQGLQQSDLEDRFDTFFDSVAAGALTGEKAQEMLNTAVAVQQLTEAFLPLGGVFTQFQTISVDAFTKVAAAAGGFEQLAQSVQAYYQAYYTEAERTQDQTEAISKALAEVNLSMPTTRDQFRALVDAQDLSTDAGRAAFNTLMTVAGAFDAVADASEAAAEAERERVEAIGSKSTELQIKLLQAQGNEQAAVNLERQIEIAQLAKLEESLNVLPGTFTGVQEAIYDLADAADAVAAASKAAAEAAEAAAKMTNVLRGASSVASDFLQGADLTFFKGTVLQDAVAKAGFGNFSVEQLLGATKADVVALWQAVGVDGKQAILEIYPLLTDLWGTMRDQEISTLIDGIASSADELASAYREIKPEADTLVDAWRKNKSAMKELQDALNEIDGTKAVSAIDQLKQAIAQRDGLRSVVSSNNDAIIDLQIGKGGQAGVDAAKRRESALASEFARTGSPEVARALTQATIARIRVEGKKEAEDRQSFAQQRYDAELAIFNLQKKQHDGARAAAQESISAAERMVALAKSVPEVLGELRAGNLSNLSYEGRLSQQRSNFSRALETGLDPQAQLTQYLTQAQQMYGGATAQYSAIFEEALAMYQAKIGEGAANAPRDIALAEATLSSIDALAPKLEQIIIDTTDREIAAYGSLNTLIDGRASTITESITVQTQILRDQLDELKQLALNQEAQITQAGAAYTALIASNDSVASLLRSQVANADLAEVISSA